MANKNNQLTRRRFLQLSAAGTLGLSSYSSVVPERAFAQSVSPGNFSGAYSA